MDDLIVEIKDIAEVAPAAIVAALLITLGWWLAKRMADDHIVDLRKVIERLMRGKNDGG